MNLISNIPARCRCIDCTPDLDAALVANPFAAQRFAAAARFYRQNVLRWIKAVMDLSRFRSGQVLMLGGLFSKATGDFQPIAKCLWRGL